MIKRIIFLSFVFITSNVFSDCGTFAFKEKDQKISLSFEVPEKNQSIKIKITDEKNSSDDAYYCMKSQDQFKCVGDDDGGSFVLKPSSKTIIISRISSGNSDVYRFNISQKEASQYKTVECSFN